jgi:hypothetical protein
MIQIFLIFSLILINKTKLIDALRVALPGPVDTPAQGCPPAGRRVVELREAPKTLSKFNPIFDTF